MEKRFFVRYFIKTSNSIGSRKDIEKDNYLGLDFKIDDNKLAVYDNKMGLWVDCYINCSSINDAEKKSEILINSILSLIDFQTSTSSFIPILDIIYDASHDLTKREYKKIFYFPIAERNIIKINIPILKEIFNVFTKNKERRIVRAINWFKKGNLEEEIVDKFIAYWTGLESINKLLIKSLDISDEEKSRKCKYCGGIVDEITSIGIEKLFTDIVGVDKSIFTKIRRTRGKLVHGEGPLDDEFINKVEGYNPIVRKTLIIGLGRLLCIEYKIIEDIIGKVPRKYSDIVKIFAKTNIVNFIPPELKYFGQQPNAVLKNKITEREINDIGELNKQGDIKIDFNVKTDGTAEIESFADNNSCIKKFKISDLRIS